MNLSESRTKYADTQFSTTSMSNGLIELGLYARSFDRDGKYFCMKITLILTLEKLLGWENESGVVDNHFMCN